MKTRKNLVYALLIVVGSSILFALTSYVISWSRVLDRREVPALVPPPPQAPVSLIGIEKGTGFEVADLIVEVGSGEEFKYLESWTGSRWEIVDEKVDVSLEECSPKIIKIFELDNGDVIECLRTTTYAEWCPSPIVYYALSSDGGLWIYKEDFPCTTINLPIFAILGIILGMFIAILYLIISKLKKNNATNPT